jgi:hypothetical protein
MDLVLMLRAAGADRVARMDHLVRVPSASFTWVRGAWGAYDRDVFAELAASRRVDAS